MKPKHPDIIQRLKEKAAAEQPQSKVERDDLSNLITAARLGLQHVTNPAELIAVSVSMARIQQVIAALAPAAAAPPTKPIAPPEAKKD